MQVQALAGDGIMQHLLQAALSTPATPTSAPRQASTPGTVNGSLAQQRGRARPLGPVNHTSATRTATSTTAGPVATAGSSSAAAAAAAFHPVILLQKIPGACFHPQCVQFLSSAKSVTVSAQPPAGQAPLFQRADADLAAGYLDQLLSAVTALPQLERLYVRGVLGSSLKHLTPHLAVATGVMHLMVDISSHGNDGVGFIAAPFMRAVCGMAALETLELRCMGLAEAGGAALAGGLPQLQSLRAVKLKDAYLMRSTKDALQKVVAARAGLTLEFLT